MLTYADVQIHRRAVLNHERMASSPGSSSDVLTSTERVPRSLSVRAELARQEQVANARI